VYCAIIDVSCDENPDNVKRGASFTDAQGLSGQDPETNAILITQKLFTATDQPDKPKIQTFKYRVKVRKSGAEKILEIDSNKSLPKRLDIVLPTAQ